MSAPDAPARAAPEPGAGLAKAYRPAEHEERLYDWWESQGFFKPETQVALGQAAPDAKPFVIAMPPPNVTGALHMGHALTAAVEDLLVRYHRLRGRPTLWVPGTDHAGIATQNVVERQLADEGLSRHDIGRDAFVARVWEWKRQFGDRITRQERSLGVSADWDRERFTLDTGLRQAVAEAFVRLYDRGLIYRGTYLVNWCPRCQTVISDIEVDHDEIEGRLYTFRYPLEGGGDIPVATTRPETILGDSAVAVHPDDPRAADLTGRTALVPVLQRRIPVIADAYVDREFGTGALKITPAHDPQDYEIGQRHALDEISVLGPDGTMTAEAGPYAGLDRGEARRRLWADMEALDLVIGEEAYTHAVGHCQRCRTVVEPLLSTQWFVRMAPLAEPALAAVAEGQVRMVPPRFTKEFFHWLDNIRDWVISRQLWWGHRIPVWYGPDGQAFAARNDEEAAAQAREHYGQEVDLTRDPDVLDTWFSSALWPFSTLGWPQDTDDLARFYPTDVMETGYDILFFWVARMIMMGEAMTGRAPFHTVYLHGMVRDAEGRKMSKSLGNVMDPLTIIEVDGCDALRFSLLTGSTPGTDMKLSGDRVAAGRNFANKLWNIGRFVLGNLGDDFVPLPQADVEGAGDGLSLADRWILSRHHRATAEATRLIDAFQLGEAGRVLVDFAWGELADWYVEASKVALNGDDPAAAEAARQVLFGVLERTLTLLHPYVPFVTEAIWGHLPRRPGDLPALMVSRWPQAGTRDEAAEAAFGRLQGLVRGIRNVRAEYEVPPGRRVAAVVAAGDAATDLAAARSLLAALARLDDAALRIEAAPSPPAEAHATVVTTEGLEAWLPLAGMIDLVKERERIGGEAAAARREVERLRGVLANQDFVTRAPAMVVQRERDRLADAEARLATLEERLAGLAEAG